MAAANLYNLYPVGSNHIIMCLYPKLIKNKKYVPNKKNKGNVPIPTDERVLYVPVGCGKCIECLKQKARGWQIRMLEEIKTDKTGKFVTLSFSNESFIKLASEVKIKSKKKIFENEVATLALRRFLERWRKKYKVSVKHWCVTELGHNNTERIHLHGIIFTNHKIEKIWQYGNVWIGDWVNAQTVNYIVKYVNKLDKDHPGYVPIVLCSPGLGKNYIEKHRNYNKYNGNETKEYYRSSNGVQIALPTYYRNKFYTDEEREKLWLQLLDKQKRYVCGEEIDISTDLTKYEKALQFYQQKNIRLGYGDDTEKWKSISYAMEYNKINALTKYKNVISLEKLIQKREKRIKIAEEKENKNIDDEYINLIKTNQDENF